MAKLEVGMKFDSMVKLCEFIGWEYDCKHSTRLSQKLSNYVSFHRENRNQVIIDKVFDPNIEMVQFRLRRNGYDYNVGDIIDVNNGQVEILEQTYIIMKNGTKRMAYKAKCLKCGYIYTDYDYNFYKHVGCGCCNGKIVVKGINDMWTTNPDLAKLLADPNDGYKYTDSSSQKTDWKCPICKTLHRNKAIRNISKRGLSCLCSKSKSYPNRFMYWLLSELSVVFYDEKVFEWSNDKRYDFYLPNDSLIIEMHGRQHYEESYSFTGKDLDYQIKNDAYKRELAIHNGILNYIEIDASQSEFDYIKRNVLNSALTHFYDLSNIDWIALKEKCETNILYEIAECWNNGIYLSEDIAKIVGLSKSPVRKYLNKCEEFGLIDKYDKELIESLRKEKVNKGIYQHQTTPIKCNENNLYFGSIAACREYMNKLTGKKFFTGNILGTADGKYKQHQGFTFSRITKEEFNEYKSQYPNKAYGDYFILDNNTKPA